MPAYYQRNLEDLPDACAACGFLHSLHGSCAAARSLAHTQDYEHPVPMCPYCDLRHPHNVMCMVARMQHANRRILQESAVRAEKVLKTGDLVELAAPTAARHDTHLRLNKALAKLSGSNGGPEAYAAHQATLDREIDRALRRK